MSSIFPIFEQQSDLPEFYAESVPMEPLAKGFWDAGAQASYLKAKSHLTIESAANMVELDTLKGLTHHLPELTEDEFNAEYSEYGLKYEPGINRPVADLMAKRKEQEMLYDMYISASNKNNSIGQTANIFLAAAAAGFTDPVSIGLSLMPIPFLNSQLFNAANILKFGVFPTRFATGVAEGLLMNSALEIFPVMASKQDQTEYSAQDAFTNVTIGAVLGGALHVGGGKIGDVIAGVKPKDRAAALLYTHRQMFRDDKELLNLVNEHVGSQYPTTYFPEDVINMDIDTLVKQRPDGKFEATVPGEKGFLNRYTIEASTKEEARNLLYELYGGYTGDKAYFSKAKELREVDIPDRTKFNGTYDQYREHVKSLLGEDGKIPDKVVQSDRSLILDFPDRVSEKFHIENVISYIRKDFVELDPAEVITLSRVLKKRSELLEEPIWKQDYEVALKEVREAYTKWVDAPPGSKGILDTALEKIKANLDAGLNTLQRAKLKDIWAGDWKKLTDVDLFRTSAGKVLAALSDKKIQDIRTLVLDTWDLLNNSKYNIGYDIDIETRDFFRELLFSRAITQVEIEQEKAMARLLSKQQLVPKAVEETLQKQNTSTTTGEIDNFLNPAHQEGIPSSAGITLKESSSNIDSMLELKAAVDKNESIIKAAGYTEEEIKIMGPDLEEAQMISKAYEEVKDVMSKYIDCMGGHYGGG